nr:hypothetical protein [Tanacetum cinerariifolium]
MSSSKLPTRLFILILSYGDSSGLEHPPLPDYIPGPEYLEYLVPSDDEEPIKDQPLPVDASPTGLLPGYVADFDPEEDQEEDPEEDPANEGDDDDDYDDDVDEEEASKEEEDDEEEEQHIALADSTTLPDVDPIHSAKDTEAFETDEFAPTPHVPSPRLRKARIFADLRHRCQLLFMHSLPRLLLL